MRRHGGTSRTVRLFGRTGHVLSMLSQSCRIEAVFGLYGTGSSKSGLMVRGTRGRFVIFPLLHRRAPGGSKDPFLYLDSFVHPLSSNVPSALKTFTSSVSTSVRKLCRRSPCGRLLMRALSSQLTRTTARGVRRCIEGRT